MPARHQPTGTQTVHPPAQSSYDQLHIYYLKGNAGSGPVFFNENFIGHWEEEDCSFLFFSEPADAEINRFLRKRPDLCLADVFRMAYEEWQPLDMFPLIAGGCCIYPPWQPAPPVRDNRHIVLDPGVVFGSGSHATTHDCLKAMALLIEQEGPLPESAIDIGTGTGLLALAAARRGIPRIVGVDNNFLAAQTAKKNAAMNDLEDNIVIVKGRAADFTHMPFDLLIANIHYEAMRNLIAADNLLNYKYFILSGLLRSPARKVLARLDKLPVKTIKVWNKNKIWCTIIGKCFD